MESNCSREELLVLKQSVHAFALSLLQDRIDHAHTAMMNAQQAANEEGKSSVGDKYETARAMGQLDSEMNARQLEEAARELKRVQQIDVAELSPTVKEGCIVKTDRGNFFVGCGLGQHRFGDMMIFFISLSSPLGKLFANKKAAEEIPFNGQKYLIKEVF